MEKITRFPILVIDRTANSSITGLGPKLRYDIRSLSGASDDDIVSERGIRDAVCNQHYNISGDTIGLGNNIFDKNEWYPRPKDNILFNTLSGIGTLTTKTSGEYIHLGSTLPDITSDLSGFIYFQRTLNGGIEQETSIALYSDFQASEEKVIFQNPKSDDVIGKILIKCNIPFDGYESFSIGIDGDPEYFIKKFFNPTKSSLNEKELVRTIYGKGLYDKVEFIDNILWKFGEHKNKDIKLFRYNPGGGKGFPYIFGNWILPGGKGTQGEMEIVIFYDKKVKLQDGFLLGGELPIQGMRLVTATSFILSQILSNNVINSAGVSSTQKGYALGGNNKNISINNIQGIVFNIEASFILNTTLKTRRMGFMNGYYSLYKGYIPGGQTDKFTYLNTIGSLDYSNETPGILSTHLNQLRYNATCLQNSIRGYLMCGGIGQVPSKTIEYLEFATEVNILFGKGLPNPTSNTMGISSYDKGYLIGGSNDKGIISKRINIFDYNTQTTNQYFKELSTPLENAGCIKSENYGFVCGGNTGTEVINTITQMDFLTNTPQIVKQTLISGLENVTGVQG